MFYKVIDGKEVGKFIMVDEIDDVAGIATSSTGKKYYLDKIREATEQELKESGNFKITSII